MEASEVSDEYQITQETQSATCITCRATFTSAAHLRRHERSHIEERSFACPFCNSLFTRSDSARRHTTTCNKRNGRPIPTPRKRGRRRQACDTCASTKSACDAQQPCSNCTRREARCTYTYRQAHDSQTQTIAVVDRSPALNLVCVTATETSGSVQIRMTFLLNYTNPRNDTLQEFFCTSTIRAEAETPEESKHTEYNETSPSVWWQSPHTLVQDMLIQEKLIQNMHLGLRITEIVYTLRSKTIFGDDIDADMAWDAAALDIFQVDKVNCFANAYFDNWHRHCPLLHRPSFDPTTSFTPLLTAILLVGALYWSEPSAAAARICLDAAERYIFEHDAFTRISQGSTSGLLSTNTGVEPLQAGFLIIVAQHWENHRDSRRLVRLHRFADLVDAARYLGLPSLRHMDGDVAPIKTEQGIRLMSWIFLVDSSHAIFHRSTPRLTLAEMTGSMPSHDWDDAPTARMSLEHCIALLMADPDPWTPAAVAAFGRLSHLDLFLLVSGLHELLYASRVVWTLSPSSQHAALDHVLDRALSRWRVLWDLHTVPYASPAPSTSPYSTSFVRHADEYWLLAKMILRERKPLVPSVPEECKTEGSLDHDQEHNKDGMDAVHDYIKQFAAVRL